MYDLDLFRKRFHDRYKELGYTIKTLSEATGISVFTIQTWLYGKNDQATGENKPYYPSLSKICKVAEVLKVSVDYFINPDMNCTTVNNQMISNYTGLTDTAINNLHADHISMNRHARSSLHYVDMVNFLTSYKDSKDILTTMYHYLFGYYVTDQDGSRTIDVMDETGIPANGATMNISNLNAVFLATLMQDLAQIKANNDNIPNAKYYGKYDPETATDRQKLFSDITPFVV